ncbi:uncharacterized protein DUF3857 [Nonlabens xylanidelens]|uniref:Uncharacterized protein DUF3857 n=1 Tax=Nonlabens xylanidelens TaxID=191564 RepID=A0A2S6IMX9_9FLAO|nr:DUF3857 domain-containing transglutaminase family protein [Nonlabens xylanidelens]PPK95612.1 uncharacterized protein DUF3857 [Nonlabens xylanidelens]PQJ22415.1 hypothetical protein BST94_02255 [Nonlabens xylanidelens]
MKTITLSIAFLLTALFSIAQVETGIAPNWLEKVTYSPTPDVNYDDLNQGTLTLIYDHQVNIPKQESYTKYATKIFENVGVQQASTINVSYDPKYQTLKFHSIKVLRDGEVIDKLKPDNFQLMRRESDAENYMYDGTMSAVMNISDVRSDDIVEYSYTIKGFNPIHKNKFSDSYYLNSYEPIGKMSITLLSENELHIKGINNPSEPQITTVNGLKKYHWNNENTKTVTYEDYSPNWKIDYQLVIVSDYDSWKDVVKWGIDTFTLKEKPNKELLKTINNIKQENSTDGEKIAATLNFVQDDIRYLGLEDGIGAYKPFMPNQVIEQRFGDCKDKSLLMSSMLNEMGIEAYPMLVSSFLKQSITEFLPSPIFFDHCVVKVIDAAGTDLYYDPTISNQGGVYDKTHFPDYQYGLVIKPENTDLDQITSHSKNTVEVYDVYELEETGKGATLKIKTVFYDYEADAMRGYFKNNSINTITKEYKNYYSNYYYNIESTKKPEFKDDLELNKFEVTEEYKIDSLWRPMPEKDGYIMAHFTPSSIEGILYTPNKEERNDPLDLYYPSTKQHKIKVILGSRWDVNNEQEEFNCTAFDYKWDVKYNKRKNEIDLTYLLKYKKDHINPSEFKEYSKQVNKVNETLGYQIYIPSSMAVGNSFINKASKSSNTVETFMIMLLVLFVIIVIILLIVWYSQRNKKHIDPFY